MWGKKQGNDKVEMEGRLIKTTDILKALRKARHGGPHL